MAVVSRIATIFLDGATGSRTLQATAAVQDTAAGSSVVVTITNGTTGAAPPNAPQTFTLRYVDDAGNIIKSVTLDNAAASQTDTFFFNTTGLSGGTARCGTIEIKLQATRTSGGPTSTYDVETDGAPNTPPTGFTTDQLDRGWIRGTTTLTEAISNVSLGGAKTQPACYDESLFVRLTQAHASYVARALSVAISSTSPALSANTNSSSTTVHDVTFSNVCDNRFPAASTSTVGPAATVPNPTLATGQPDWTFTSTTDDTITVDPRLTVTHLLQVDDASAGTPPMGKHVATGQRQATQLGYVGAHFRNSRGSQVGDTISGGVNGLSWSFSLQDAGAQTTPLTATGSTVTRGGEAGWTTFLQWSSQLPGGEWNNTVSLTAPADIIGASYLLNNVSDFVLLAVSPALQLLLAGGNVTEPKNHMMAGDALVVGVAMRNRQTLLYEPLDIVPPPTVVLQRFNLATGKGQFLDSDGQTWVDFVNGGETPAVEHALTEGVADPNVWTKTFTLTDDWEPYDIVLSALGYVGMTPYPEKALVTVEGRANPHADNEFDGAGFATKLPFM